MVWRTKSMEAQNPNNNNNNNNRNREESSSSPSPSPSPSPLPLELGVGGEEGISEPWEVMARDWVSTLPDDGNLIRPDEIETWVQSNHAHIPHHIYSMPRPDLFQLFASIRSSLQQSHLHLEEKDANHYDHSQARFQRTDRWLPVYSWLESVDSEEVVKSKDILDWLASNPEVKDDLYARHSRYHLMHYIKKCHVKILKRKERKKGLQIIDKANMTVTSKIEERKRPAPLPCNLLNNIPNDSDLYFAKRNEALRKYEILLELESQLSTLFPKPDGVKFLKNS